MQPPAAERPPRSDPQPPPGGAWALWVVAALAAAIVVLAVQYAISSQRGTELTDSDAAFHPDGWDGASPDFDRDLYNPVFAGETLPDGYRPVLARDGIRPVYVPRFVRAEDSEWPDDELIIGVEIDSDARAYPVGFLNRREIVVDMHRGIPTFVTW